MPLRVLSIDVGSGNYALCALTLAGASSEFALDRLECWRLGDPKATPASGLLDRLLQRFQTWDLWTEGDWRPDRVLIEQQMRAAHANVALAFGTYAMLRTLCPNAEVRFVRPSRKFNGFREMLPALALPPPPPPTTTTAASPRTTHQGRKRLAVSLAEAILAQSGHPSLATTCPGQKKDDLADAFLQAFC
jgi:hypothetical protein